MQIRKAQGKIVARAHPITFLASEAPAAQSALRRLTARYGSAPEAEAQRIVALGGDGFMLQTLHAMERRDIAVYGMNCGTIGFLMNEYSEDDLFARLEAAEETVINPLVMRAESRDGVQEALAINEVALLRAGPQAAKLRISIDGRVRLDALVCDGALLSTPAGSTAYNYSAHGPILPIGSDVLALTAMAAFRPRRWRGRSCPRRRWFALMSWSPKSGPSWPMPTAGRRSAMCCQSRSVRNPLSATGSCSTPVTGLRNG